MRAVGFMEFGGPEVLQVIDVPEVHPGQGEIRIKNHAATVNPTDLLARNGSRAETMRTDPPPYIPGMEIAGIVDEIGEGTDSEFSIGDKVLGIVVTKGAHGGYREQIVLNTKSVVRMPGGKTYAEACTLPMNALTARQVIDRLNLKPGEVICVTGAAGAFGGYVIQLAKSDGLTVVADASDKDVELVKNLGADIVVGRGPEFSEHVRKYFRDGVDGLADGAVLRDGAVPALKDGGAFSSVRGWQGNGDRNIRFEITSVRSYAFEKSKLEKLRDQVEEGVLTLRLAEVFSPENASEAHRRLENGGIRGRLVIQF